MKNCTVITGASSGIGENYAYELARYGYNILLVARREDRLVTIANKLRNKYNVEVDYKKVDLTVADERDLLCEYIEKNHQISILVNNAGFGIYGYFDEESRLSQLEMIALNVVALVDLTHRLIPNLKKDNSNNKTYIINVGSVAGFQPGPFLAVYYATKSFVLNFSEALNYEMEKQKNNNIVVSVVCPGPTQSEFGERAGFSLQGNSKDKNMLTSMLKNKKIPSSMDLVKYSLKKILKSNKTVVVHGTQFKLLLFFNRLFSRKQVIALVGWMQSKRAVE